MSDGPAPYQPPFADFLGVRITESSPDRVVAELVATENLLNRNGVLHGGAVMALADVLGGTATFLNLAEKAGTTTIESKTNFFASIRPGETAVAECVPLHRGRSTQVWQTTIRRQDGRLAALVTQTQMVLSPRKDGP